MSFTCCGFKSKISQVGLSFLAWVNIHGSVVLPLLNCQRKRVFSKLSETTSTKFPCPSTAKEQK